MFGLIEKSFLFNRVNRVDIAHPIQVYAISVMLTIFPLVRLIR